MCAADEGVRQAEEDGEEACAGGGGVEAQEEGDAFAGEEVVESRTVR